MTAPIWMAAPPEVHSALLSSGPGSGPLMAAAGAWNTLSAEYAAVAEELAAVLADVQARAWEGPSAESYVAAHLPYLAWLMQASANSAAEAAQHETAAAAHTAALAAMPTLAELATNHIVHGLLVATNFFGINTIPIALNEADYVRMWIQAATTMSTYQAVAGSAVASTPQSEPAPPILKASAAQTDADDDSGPSTGLGTLLESLVQKLGVPDQISDEFGIDNIYDFLNNPVSYTESHAIYRLLTDPLAVLENPLYLFYDGDEVFFALGQAILPTASLNLSIAPVGSAGGLAALAAAAAAQPAPTAVAPALAPVAAAPAAVPVAGLAPTAVASAVAPGAAPAPGPAPAPATAASTLTSSAPPPGPPAAGGTGFVPPYVVGPPIVGAYSVLRSAASSSAKRNALQPDTAAAAAAAAREQARARRRRRATQRGHGDEFVDVDVQVDPIWVEEAVGSTVASDRGAGMLGLAGTTSKDSAKSAGFTTLSGDEFGGGPSVPMLPNTWDPTAPEAEGEHS
ncbi:PPE family protein [Mycobacterium sp.]|uniref:PPE family protein n=1 Tax=Mycobacterium sp. TaxID=1785 RepID=UPI003F950AAF